MCIRDRDHDGAVLLAVGSGVLKVEAAGQLVVELDGAALPGTAEGVLELSLIHIFGRFFARFIAILYIMELYDIAFFDWVLLCHSNFFPHFYPELKGVVGSHQFGYNKKSHITHFIVYIPVCAALAGICMLF